MALDTGNTTSPGPEIPVVSASSLANNFNYGIEIAQKSQIPSATGVFNGSLSSHGNVIAMQINQGDYKSILIGDAGIDGPIYTYQPYLTGFLREYWRDPTQCTFGADSACPALTAVMPSQFTRTPGNALYYIDLQMTRLSGSNFFNNLYFINSFNQTLSWVTNSNTYLAALDNIETNNLNYYGSNTYQEFLTQGFSNYAIGQALRSALRNSGSMVVQISSGNFGTANAVAKQLLETGLGSIGNLTAKLTAANINFSDIYNSTYTAKITEILESITSKNDLSIIQSVIKSSISNMTSPADYTSIEKCSGRSNDSIYTSLYDFGRNIYERMPGFAFTNGVQLANLIDLVLTQTSTNVENLATNSSLLPQEIIDSFRDKLPESPNGGTVNILNVIGCASGYLLDQLTAVNDFINQLSQTTYGTQIHNSLNNVTTAYNAYMASFSPGDSETGIGASYDFRLEQNFNNAKSQYYSLLNTIANDPVTAPLIAQINSNWNSLCENLSYEVVNYNKANIDVSQFSDNTQILNFVAGLPSYATDPQNLGLDFFLYNLCQPNQAGDIVKSILNQAKNNESLSAAGVKIRGIV